MDETALIRDMFKKADVDLTKNDVWQVQSATVVKHKALERLAAALKIVFDAPLVLRAERDEAVILATGRIGEAVEWSIGEACVNVNYRVVGKMAAYVYAMAEKRSKDRVILKLAGLHGIYSEDEADDFKNHDDSPVQKSRDPKPTSFSEAESALRMAARNGRSALNDCYQALDNETAVKLLPVINSQIVPIAEAADKAKKRVAA